MGFLGLMPVTRIIFIKVLASYVLYRYGVKQNPDNKVFEGEFVNLDDEDKLN